MGSTPLRQQLSLMRQSFFDEVFFFFFFILGVGQLLPSIILGDGKGNEAFSLRKNFEVIYGLLDHGQVSYLETLENEDDPDFIEDVFSLFLRDSSRYIAAIDKALETTPDDYPFILERMMYRLKGSSARASLLWTWKMAAPILFFGFLALSFSFALASDPSPLQDFCVADGDSNGICKSFLSMVWLARIPRRFKLSHFSFSGLHLAGNTSNAVGSRVTTVNVAQIPGLNTLGISLVRIDYAPWGINPPHTHPRATEILTVLEGCLEVGFVTSNPENRLITKILQKGDVFVFPIGLVHYQRNVGNGNVVAIAALSSQNPGVITIANAVFGSSAEIPVDILAKAFQLDKNVSFMDESNYQNFENRNLIKRYIENQSSNVKEKVKQEHHEDIPFSLLSYKCLHLHIFDGI
ncbi:unnamed protein product [Dovyalis caffra]|uniref:Cupin type-1 domain-containing protein n=1 Tax=Dovyalis caffra TaxID=77055 RepID=A0AAV1S370_9ROSI|nr:unnamed protein product [Dovyalis caffra]